MTDFLWPHSLEFVVLKISLVELTVKDECESGPCQNSGTCDPQFKKYTCTCALGYTGHNCETGVYL